MGDGMLVMAAGTLIAAMGWLTIKNPARWWLEFGVPPSFATKPEIRRLMGVLQVVIGLALFATGVAALVR